MRLILRALLPAAASTLARLGVLIAVVLALVAATLYSLRPQPGDWQTTLRVALPDALAGRWLTHALPASWSLQQAPQLHASTAAPLPTQRAEASLLSVPVGITATIHWATQPAVAQLLSGSRWPTRHGVLQLGWDADTLTQTIHCAPCTLAIPALGTHPITLADATVTLRREGEQLAGQVRAGAVVGQWQGTLTAQQFNGQLQVHAQPLSDAFALFAADIPEVQRARITGQFSLQAQLQLPDWRLAIEPTLQDFEVRGLDTQTLPFTPIHCTHRDVEIPPDSLLARAVIATEDQRFFTHPGYDLVEWQNSLRHNQARSVGDGQPLRGASTLTQQLAKISYTEADRTPLRKLRELLYAVELEQTLGKPRILQEYLQRVYWGEGLCGGEAAAQHYFGIAAAQLNPAQAAWLAAMLHRPDHHARQWKDSGRIDVQRTRWVLDQLRMRPRELSQRERSRWQTYIAEHDWKRKPHNTQ